VTLTGSVRATLNGTMSISANIPRLRANRIAEAAPGWPDDLASIEGLMRQTTERLLTQGDNIPGKREIA
jgi:hypothetical protein